MIKKIIIFLFLAYSAQAAEEIEVKYITVRGIALYNNTEWYTFKIQFIDPSLNIKKTIHNYFSLNGEDEAFMLSSRDARMDFFDPKIVRASYDRAGKQVVFELKKGWFGKYNSGNIFISNKGNLRIISSETRFTTIKIRPPLQNTQCRDLFI